MYAWNIFYDFMREKCIISRDNIIKEKIGWKN